MEVIARIDTSTPSGRKIVRELEKKKSVQMEYMLPDAITKKPTHSVEQVFDECLDILSEHYNTDCKKIWKSIE